MDELYHLPSMLHNCSERSVELQIYRKSLQCHFYRDIYVNIKHIIVCSAFKDYDK